VVSSWSPSRSNEEEVAAIERERPLREKLILKMPTQGQIPTEVSIRRLLPFCLLPAVERGEVTLRPELTVRKTAA